MSAPTHFKKEVQELNMPRTYVDNASNRSLGRVGMSVGSMPVSRGSSGGSSGGGGGSYGGSSSGSSTRTYVDNSSNRSLGRVGMAHGTAVASKSGASSSHGSSGSTKTYVDNSYNRSLGRVGMDHGTAVASRSGSGSSHGNRNASSVTKTYVDNPYNRSIGRVGKEHGSAVVSKSGTSGSKDSSTRSQDSSKGSSSSDKVYVDNAMNRRLGRVGKPLGSMPFSRSSSTKSSPGNYVDNAYNRSLGRVGKKRGTMPVSKSKETKAIIDLYQRATEHPSEDIQFMETDNNEHTCDVVMDLINRLNQVELWQNQTGSKSQPMTSDRLLNDYDGTIIPFEELDLQAKIGSGGFGDVHFAKWRESVVAVKKLRVQRVSKKRLREFTDELLVFCSLKHGNIVKFIGACVVTPHLAIVMEYMDCSLYEAIHVKNDHDFSGNERLSIIQQILQGLKYLHTEQIAHCDLKSLNVLLNLSDVPVAKLTDFGLSMMRVESESSVSAAVSVRNIGTPRYSAPEVLRGELLDRRDMMRADMYSVSLVVFEVIYEDEPFPSLTYTQLCKHVGDGSAIPDIPSTIQISPTLLRSMKYCWNRRADQRPTAARFLETVGSLRSLMD